MVYTGVGDCAGRRTAWRGRKPDLLYPDRDRGWHHRFCDGTIRRKKKMAEKDGIKRNKIPGRRAA